MTTFIRKLRSESPLGAADRARHARGDGISDRVTVLDYGEVIAEGLCQPRCVPSLRHRGLPGPPRGRSLTCRSSSSATSTPISRAITRCAASPSRSTRRDRHVIGSIGAGKIDDAPDDLGLSSRVSARSPCATSGSTDAAPPDRGSGVCQSPEGRRVFGRMTRSRTCRWEPSPEGRLRHRCGRTSAYSGCSRACASVPGRRPGRFRGEQQMLAMGRALMSQRKCCSSTSRPSASPRSWSSRSSRSSRKSTVRDDILLVEQILWPSRLEPRLRAADRRGRPGGRRRGTRGERRRPPRLTGEV